MGEIILCGEGEELRVLAVLESPVTLKVLLYLNKHICLAQTMLRRTGHLINQWNFLGKHLASDVLIFFPLWKNVISSGDMGSCCWFLLFGPCCCNNGGEQISFRALLRHCAPELNLKAAELINREKMSCFTVFLQDVERETS